jgi:hypothetical protein
MAPVAGGARAAVLASSAVLRRAPPDAEQPVRALGRRSFQQGPGHYDRQRGRWRSVLDERQHRHG